MIKKTNIAGFKIARISQSEVLNLIEEYIKSKKPHQIATVNPEFVVSAQKDKEIKKVLNKADLLLPDGIGIAIASRLLGKPIQNRITGTDLIPKLAKNCAVFNHSIYFLGAKEGIAAKTAETLKNAFPKLKIAGTYAGSPHDSDLVPKIKKTHPDVLLVAFGHPKQEKWIAKYKDRLGVPVMIGVGGAFDFISGKTVRAPFTLRKIGLEWLYRLIKEPWRFKRQLKLVSFVALVISCTIKRIK